MISTLEAGVNLFGWEVKSMKAGQVNFRQAFVDFTPEGLLILRGGSVSSWKSAPKETAAMENRDRMLLVKRSEAAKIGGLAKRPGYTLIPLEAYVNDRGLIKVTIALVRGRRKYEKKQKLKERDMKKQIDMDMRKHSA